MEQNIKKNKIIIIGRTNVGKSTLFNNIINKEISIVTNKKNTTIRAVEAFGQSDIDFINLIDLPGPVLRSKDKFSINKLIYSFIDNSDLILFVLEENLLKNDDYFLMELLKKKNKKIFLIINKIDEFFNKKIILTFINKLKNFNIFQEIIPVSCKENINIDLLNSKIFVSLKNYKISIRNRNFILKDIIRYSLLSSLEKELPYIINFELFFKKNNNKNNIIFINLFVKKDAQKKIIIGLNGIKIKEIKKQIEKKITALYKKKYIIKIDIKKNDN